MNLELGKVYQTKTGLTVTIESIDYTYTRPAFGQIRDADGKVVRPASFTMNGMYLINKESEYDLIQTD